MASSTLKLDPLEKPKYLQQDQISEEFKDQVLSMPRAKGWVVADLHQYQGFWHTTTQVQGALSCQKSFQSLDSDIILSTSPKSGTTWLKAIAFSLLNRRPAIGKPHPLLSQNPHSLVPFLELGHHVSDGDGDRHPRLLGTHLPFASLPDSVKISASKIVYLCRNPKDIFVSFYHFTNKLRPEGSGENPMEECFDKFCGGVSIYGPFWDHFLGYWKESLDRPEKVMFLRFEDMKRNPSFHVKNLAEFIGCPFTKEEEDDGEVENVLKLCSFESLSNLEVNKTGKLSSGEANRTFFRRGEVGDWHNHLTPEMAEKLDSIVEEKLHVFGLKFD